METDIIKLIIKCSENVIEDQIVTCKLSWTVGQLKTHLSMVYPTKPEPKIQKLIYCGQYLNNSLGLKNIFSNQLTSNNIFTIYLLTNNTLKSYDKKENEYFRMNICGKGLNKNQIIWIKQVYKYYILNYVQIISTQRCSLLNSNSYNRYNTIQHNFLLDIWGRAENERQSMNITQTDIRNNNNNNNNNNHNFDNNINNEGRQDIDPGNNRDWLDNFYILSRVIILFSIVYFYASPMRFMVVTLLGFLIYLYHNRFFRTVQSDQTNNQRDQVNNNQFLQNENEFVAEERAMRTLSDESEMPDRINRNNGNPPERPGALLFIWTFFSSFFTSMIPEQPNIS